MTRARQRHVQQAQVFLDAGAVDRHQSLVRQRQVEPALVAGVDELEEAAVAAVGLARGGGERQVDQRILEAFRLVHRDHLDQVGIAFQAQHAFFAALVTPTALPHAGDLFGKPADQRLFAIEAAAGRLQQFGQVQQVG